jgi:DNA-binding XRE family transcriptional regulator
MTDHSDPVKHDVVLRDGRPAYVRVPVREWRRLVRRLERAEDRADVEAYDRAKARGGEVYPIEIFERSLDGESRIKLFREHRRLTQVQLAKRAGLSTLYISQLETKRRAGSAGTLRKIADVLSVDIDLIAPR